MAPKRVCRSVSSAHCTMRFSLSAQTRRWARRACVALEHRACESTGAVDRVGRIGPGVGVADYDTMSIESPEQEIFTRIRNYIVIAVRRDS